MANENFENQEDLGFGGKVKNWVQDNIRIIISVLIVVVIAGGIYSYSNRSQQPTPQESDLAGEFEVKKQQVKEEAETAKEEAQEKAQVAKNEAQEKAETAKEQVKEVVETGKEAAQTKIEEVKEKVEEVRSTSQETDEAFVETAVAGDSQTTLARKALASYLEKNNDSELTAEHKIYIEDYLRKNVDYSGGIEVGKQVSFPKTLIEEAINQSKGLSDAELNNLKKYSARVSNLQ